MQFRVLLELQHVLQLGHVRQPLVGPQVLGEDGAERRVGAVHPAPRRHAVGHVHDLVGLADVAAVLVELWERLLLDDLSVNGCHAVHLVGPHDGQISHADLLNIAFLEDAQRRDHRTALAVLGLEVFDPAEVQLPDELQMSRQHAFDHFHGPLLQGLGHHRVVGIVQALGGEVPGLVPGHLHHVHQQTHHLGHCNGGVCVVHLNRHLGWQVGPLVVGPLDELAKQVLQGGAHEEVLLSQSQLLALIGGVVGIQHRREILRLASALHGVRKVCCEELVQVKLLGGTRSPETQVIRVVSVEARDGVVVSHGLNNLSAHPVHTPVALVIGAVDHLTVETHGVGDVRARNLEGATVADPKVRAFHLAPILDLLFKHAVAVSDTIAPARERKGGHGVQEAGGQPSQATVAQRRVGLFVEEILQFHAETMESFLEGLLKIQIRNGVLHVAANEILSRKVVSSLHIHLPVVRVRIVQGF
mmetsp:Transcript_68254/g.107243  ORF Transcript_68254/g.107243 Transcript_68254/m.107243 type:complete len:472 (+) Transcript_68254:1031-2446(+)